MTFDSITNRAEFFSDHYLDARLATDLDNLRRTWDVAEGRGEATARAGLKRLGQTFFPNRAAAAEAGAADYANAVRALNDAVLTALGFSVDRVEVALSRNDGTDELKAMIAARVDTPAGLLLLAVDAGLAVDVDKVFDTESRDGVSAPGLLVTPMSRDNGHVEITSVADAPGELFALDDPPRIVLICAGSTILLAERSKWAEGRYLAVELEAALERADVTARGELETVAALFSADALVPGDGSDSDASEMSFFDSVEENSTRHAVGVSKELREGMRMSVQILANEVIQQQSREKKMGIYTGEDEIDPAELTRQCLRYLYRLIVLLYAESRPELGVLPTNDLAYQAGYSLDRLRELVLISLDDDHSRNGTHLDESLRVLFDLVNDGYHSEDAVRALELPMHPEITVDVPSRSTEAYLEFPGLDATIFDPGSTGLLDRVSLRNEAVQKVLSMLMLSRESARRGDQRGFISYAQLGINQLGAVYEGLMAYSGFFAKEDLFEVARGGDPTDGTWMVPLTQAEEYPEEVFVQFRDPLTGRTNRVQHARGSFVYRLAGRDRQRSASYYTPEVLTSCVVRHSLAELLGTDARARVAGGASGITAAREILDLTICEPALGSGAFLNEAINQLSAEYMKRRQEELGETLDAERYQRELQKVKAHFALHQCYGVDLNATAVELAEVSLWLNCMYPGLKAPWFGLRLRRGNSLVGARRATWRSGRLKDRIWTRSATGEVIPPRDRPLSEALEADEIHHFLLPGNGWGALAARREARELAPSESRQLGTWRTEILRSPSHKDGARLSALAAGVERLWSEAADVLDLLHNRMRRSLSLYGSDGTVAAPSDDRRKAEAILNNRDSALGRLRLVMDAWVGLWFWPAGEPVAPPTWSEWIAALEEVVGVEPTISSGQLDFFSDMEAIAAIELQRSQARGSTNDVRAKYPWLARSQELAEAEGAWHWELELAPIFRRGGFDLQVGNPPWVDWSWSHGEVLDDLDARHALLHAGSDIRSEDLAEYLSMLASHTGVLGLLGMFSMSLPLQGLAPNLYRNFLVLCLSHGAPKGLIGLVHPDTHFTDMRCGALREVLLPRLDRCWRFVNQGKLFEEIGNTVRFALNIYSSGRPQPLPLRLLLMNRCISPVEIAGSLVSDGTRPLLSARTPDGGWRLVGHQDRVLDLDADELRSLAHVFGADASHISGEMVPRVPELFSRTDTVAASRLGQCRRLPSSSIEPEPGFKETASVSAGILTRSSAFDPDEILQSAHITNGCLYAQQTKAIHRNHRDYEPLDLETVGSVSGRRTLFHRGLGATGMGSHPGFALFMRRRVDIEGERTMNTAIAPSTVGHVDSIISLHGLDPEELAQLAGLWAALPVDWLVRCMGKADVQHDTLAVLPVATDGPLATFIAVRALRLNCLTADYELLWRLLYSPSWEQDRWTNHSLGVRTLGDVGPEWNPTTPLRREQDRRQALVELDALAALRFGLSAEQLCTMFRTQFPVLRKYEHSMVFDAEGRKICAHHQSTGNRQARLQQEAAAGTRTVQWRSIWQLYLAWDSNNGAVDWEGHYTPPFTRPDREDDMTAAYAEFSRRQALGAPS